MTNSAQFETIMNIEKMKGFTTDILSVSKKLMDVKDRIKEADEALTFSWLGAAREFYYDASQSIQNKMIKDYTILNRCSEFMSNTADRRVEIDEKSGNAASN